MKRLQLLAKRLLAYGLSGTLVLPLPLHAGPTDIANGPLGQPATSVNPNLMLILDDSGSMGRQFTPDYVSTYLAGGVDVVTKNCFDSKDTSDTLVSEPDECWAGDPPAMSPDFNVQYYNPEIRYVPAVNYDGSSRMSMTCENTGGTVTSGVCSNGWTSTLTDNVSASSMNRARKDLHTGTAVGVASTPGSSLGTWNAYTDSSGNPPSGGLLKNTMNLPTEFPDRVWCTAKANAATDTALCKTNSAYTYPDASFGYGLDTAGRRKYKFGAPYYYRIVPTEFCADAKLTNCVASESPTVVSGVSYNVPAPVRFCTDSALGDCQAKRDPTTGGGDTRTALHPKFVGNLSGGANVAVKATGKITVTNPQADTALGSVTSIMVGGVDITAGGVTLLGGQTATQWATAISNRINTAVTTPNYTATSSANVVTITHPVAGAANNGLAIAVNTNVISKSPAWIAINITGTARSQSSPTWGNVSSLVIDGQQFVPGTIVCNTANCNHSSAVQRDREMAARIRAGLVPPAGWTVGGSNNQVTIIAPMTTGSEYNLLPKSVVSITTANTAASNAGGGAMVLAGGVTTGDVNHTTQNFSGGADASARQNVGRFVRTDIVPFQSAGGTVHSYEEPFASLPNNQYEVKSGQSWGQTFRYDSPGATYSVDQVGLVLYRAVDAPPGQTLTVSLRSSWGGPAIASGTVSSSSLGTAEAWVNVSLASSATLNDNLTYFLRVDNSGPEKVFVGAIDAGGYAVGDLIQNGGGVETGKDMVFRLVSAGIPATYNKYPARTDCAGSVCSYTEEMANFANWFAYYRTRMQMAKTAIGRAFIGLTDNFRVGYMTINFNTSHYRAVAPFAAGAGSEKDLWYQRLYAADAFGGTPLRAALSRTGRYFGNQNPGGNMGASPIISACQPNYAVLTSDGYWNDAASAADKLNGTDISADLDGDGSASTLADVAYHYYNTDLSTAGTGAPSPVGGFKNQVPSSGIDTAPHQHLTTFTVGMGVSGTLLFHPNYLEAGNSLDYDSITDGIAATTPNQWPAPVGDTDTTIDDMWHAAVNGKGRFFSANNPVELANGLVEVLTAVQRRIGAGAAAATSNLQPVAGDNFAFTAQYQTVEWSGDLKARTISLTDGVISSNELWSAQAQLDQRTNLNRRIYTSDANDTDSSATVTVAGASRSQNANKLRSFCPTDAPLASYPTCDDGGLLTQQEMDDHFDPLVGPNGALLQTGTWPVGDPRIGAATKASLVRYLRGETANEMLSGGVAVTDLYRNRAHLLGDIVNAQPAYVKGSPFSYSAATNPFYIDFRNTTNGNSGTRKGTVYVAANDGMLHAFETDPDNVPYYQNAGVSTPDLLADDTFTGTLNTDPMAGEGAERWAYVPSLLFPNLKRLAEENYSTNHRYYVDGSPQIGDVCFGHTASTPCTAANKWHTILVGGLNAGGRGYYALDVTNPDVPKGLWELKGGTGTKCLTDAEANSGSYGEDCNLGLSFGNPIITKRPADDRWVVLLTSGYNNVSPGDGRGYLYIVDAETGRILQRMTTGVGDATNPSGLARINSWVNESLLDNTSLAVYGGDVQGNLWRFQLDDAPAIPRHSVTLLAAVKDPSNLAQPITTRPELGEVSNKRVVFIGTGKFLGATDKTNNQRQSIYAIKDTLAGTTPVHDMTRSGGITGFVEQTFTESGTDSRVVTTPIAVDFASNNGWFVDLPDGASGEEAAERVNVDPILQFGTLVVPSNVPSTESCTAGGFGWINFLDFKTGATVPTGVTGTPVSVRIGGSLVVGINVVKIGNTIKTIVTTADNQQITKDTPIMPNAVEGRRVTWRELFVE